MGTPKAMLDAGGITFIERVIQSLRDGGCEQILVALPTLKGPISTKATENGAMVITNHCPAEGPIGSLRVALRTLSLSVDGIAFCPVDYPLLQADTVLTLIEEMELKNAPLTIPIFQGKRGHPVVFKKTLFNELLNGYLPQGAKTVVHRHLDVASLVPVEDEGVVIDINDMKDYRKHFPDSCRKNFQVR